jgi:predicted permease
LITSILSDLRYAARALGNAPGFAAAAIVTIALGVGVNAGVFTVLNGLLLRDLPAPDARALVSIEQTVEGGAFTAMAGVGTFTVPEYREYRERTQTLSGLLAHSDPRETTLGGDTPRKVYGAIVSCNYFTVLGNAPALGRALGERDCDAGAEPVVVLGHGLWTSSFAADPTIVGRAVELDGSFFTVVGVAADGTYGGSPLETAYFAPLSTEPLLWPGASRFEDPRYRWLSLIGRVGDGASFEQVRAELAVVAAQIDQRESGRSTVLAIERATRRAVPGFLRGPATGAAAVLMAAFGLLLVLACANVGNLLLARGTARGQELGIRLSLGASRARIVRQLLAESLIIALAGGALGAVLALWSFQALVALAVPVAMHPELPAVVLDLDFSADVRVLTFVLVATVGTGVLFGLAPALHASKPDLNSVLKQDTATGAADASRLRAILVGVQVALCMALMIATGLLVRGLQATYAIDPGFNYRDVAHLSFGTDGGPAILDRRMLEEVAALPGVEAVAYATQTPLGESIVGLPLRLPNQAASEARRAELDAVTPGFFSVLELPIVRGRNFTEAESADASGEAATRPAIVTETTARNFFGESDPLGRTLLLQDTTLEIVGVAADARLGGLGAVDPYYVFVPLRERGELLVRSRADFPTTAAGIRALVVARDPTLAFRVLPLEANIGWSRGVSGLVATIGAGLGGLALALAAVGIYGVVSYTVARRYREIGIRMALGATARDLLRTVLERTMRPVLIGAAAGVLAAAALSRVLSGVLFGVSPADPVGIGGAALVVLGAGLAAGWLAASPAVRADPTTSLRNE